jgi:hypothetical protein
VRSRGRPLAKGSWSESPDRLFRDLPRRRHASPFDHQGQMLSTYVGKALETPDVALQLPTGSGKMRSGVDEPGLVAGRERLLDVLGRVHGRPLRSSLRLRKVGRLRHPECVAQGLARFFRSCRWPRIWDIM